MNKVSLFFLIILSVAGISFFASCSSCQTQKQAAENTPPIPSYTQQSPDFNPDSAYAYIEKQVNFGPRVPKTTAHQACGNYLVARLNAFGAQVVEQKANITHYTGENIPIRNIIGTFFPEKEKRVLLFAHWDSRPFADEENDPQRQKQPIAGADDGASGVGILLEIARQLQQTPTEVGVDIIFFDMEDWGQPSFDKDFVEGDWWCVGSRYWAEHPHTPDYKADFGILLDMVGAPDATFTKEEYSMQYASNMVEKVWSTAARLGYGNYFIQKRGGYITDDHVPVNEYHRAPSIDIINLKDNTGTGFATHWHTLNDDMRNIHRETLNAVGQTVMEVIYNEK